MNTPATFTGRTRDPARAAEVAADLRAALIDAERKLPADEVIARTAIFIAGFVSLEAAFEQPQFAEVNRDIRVTLTAYQCALLERTSPAILGQRHLLDAQNLRDDAAYEAGEAEADATSAERFVDPTIAGQWRARAERHRQNAAKALDEARRLEDRARALGVNTVREVA